MFFLCVCVADIVRSDIALDKQKGCKLAHHPDIMLELQREKAATTQLVLLKEQLSNIYSNITITGRRSNTQTPLCFGHLLLWQHLLDSVGHDLALTWYLRFARVNLQLLEWQKQFLKQECGDGWGAVAEACLQCIDIFTCNT